MPVCRTSFGQGSSIGCRLLAAACVLATIAMAYPAAASTPEWFGRPYRYVVIDQDVRAVLAQFGRTLQVPVAASEAVRGRVQGRVEAGTAGEFLDRVSERNDLVWYFDGRILHVDANSEQATRILGADGIDPMRVVREVERLGLADPRFALRGVEGARTVMVSGPPSYVSAVEAVMRTIERPAPLAADDRRVRVFRGGVPAGDVTAADDAAAGAGTP